MQIAIKGFPRALAPARFSFTVLSMQDEIAILFHQRQKIIQTA